MRLPVVWRTIVPYFIPDLPTEESKGWLAYRSI